MYLTCHSWVLICVSSRDVADNRVFYFAVTLSPNLIHQLGNIVVNLFIVFFFVVAGIHFQAYCNTIVCLLHAFVEC